MESQLTIALARQAVLSRQMDVIATNLANVTTAAFKAESMIFTEIIETDPLTGEFLSLVHDVGFVRDLSEGPMVGTSNPLDLALHDEGYFVVETPDGPRYTRHGVFQLDPAGQVVTTEGHPVLNTANAPILVPLDADNIVVTRDGTISADANEIGRFQVVRFADEQALKKLGSGLYDAEAQLPLPAPEAEILQGMVENSNVNGVTEITRMIDTVRNYQAAAALADTEHQRILDAIEALTTTTTA
ncbi:MAG: flagellar hook-basal body complex protein [Kiloniellaceae bacterium]